MSLSSELKNHTRKLLIRLTIEIGGGGGGGYHPDTSSSEYINEPGLPNTWSAEDLKTIDLINALAHHLLGDEVYDVTLKKFDDLGTRREALPMFDQVLQEVQAWLTRCGVSTPESKRVAIAEADMRWIMECWDSNREQEDDDLRAHDREMYEQHYREGCEGIDDLSLDELTQCLVEDLCELYENGEDDIEAVKTFLDECP